MDASPEPEDRDMRWSEFITLIGGAACQGAVHTQPKADIKAHH
jgi:hypothetical protein